MPPFLPFPPSLSSFLPSFIYSLGYGHWSGSHQDKHVLPWKSTIGWGPKNAAPGCTGAEGGRPREEEGCGSQWGNAPRGKFWSGQMKPICWRAWDGRSESKSCVQDDEAWAGQSSGARRRSSSLWRGSIGPWFSWMGQLWNGKRFKAEGEN